jgi:hypothetical protein
VNDTNAAAARRWIAERLLWERFLEQAARPTADVVDEAPAREAA